MKKTFKLNGLDCANCAAKMETAIGKLPNVSSVNINFMTTKMVLEAADDKMDEVIEAAKAAVKKLEPHVEVVKA